MRFLLVILGVLLITASPARADEIRLKNGSVINGRIVREDRESIVIDLGRGRMSIARRDIVSIRRTSGTETGPSDPGRDDPAPRSEPSARATKSPRATPTTGGIPRTTPQTPRKRRDRATAGGPKVVPVERTPPKAPKGAGPESASPSRKPATRATSAPTRDPDC
jgi:hypothetical protein